MADAGNGRVLLCASLVLMSALLSVMAASQDFLWLALVTGHGCLYALWCTRGALAEYGRWQARERASQAALTAALRDADPQVRYTAALTQRADARVLPLLAVCRGEAWSDAGRSTLHTHSGKKVHSIRAACTLIDAVARGAAVRQADPQAGDCGPRPWTPPGQRRGPP
jgi:hypothetical protein